ncbi:hypothetical protein Poli38472_008969 [Pythium oligandrum]|uniref:Deacetylase sirtuin-type domain-containing protein n=1 Tax=Pythium oligandrum TaxID=41045 RepID=A0A8K1FMF1_PYTOL|nr:hypothetical protein Poli38472_008969 [Pythium oligandrum]|eukprot:TMW64802.1 hypothetical protein Poli38472_008969 [Pythium oligandrum]
MMTDDVWKRAAAKIAAADFLLVAAGAGFSADSGLPVYNDIAAVEAYEKQGLEYQDLCDPYWLEEDEQIFYGFWGNCVNAYRDTKPHPGYAILQQWKNRLVARRAGQYTFEKTLGQLQLSGAVPQTGTESAITKDPFFVYTSNVDGHFHHHFQANEVYELHGSVETWQCAGSVDGSSSRRPCDEPWKLPANARFAVDPLTMRSDGRAVVTCPHCGDQARPNVLMFHDKNWIANSDKERGYVAWEAVMEQMLEDNPSLKLVVLEIGCGMRVPSVRKETEMVVADVFGRCAERQRDQASLIRINPDFPDCEHPVLKAEDLVISLRSTGLAALTRIDGLIRSLGQSTQTHEA